ncbi:CTP synthase [uncultured Neglectibacter sp.]|uniref:CTP synthase n=1 Tax=uncultured Neglectibacter sp. TaxID=1924108 RepID=UPI0034DF0198
MTKYIFVTGGVVSGLGKGITAASLGRLLKARGLKVAAQKLDPYINVDPGTMSPYQHGEVYVTEDGLETDLDLGHYERFIDEDLNKFSNLTTGKVYWNVLNKERRGEYLGETVQVIPHVTEEIRNFIYSVGSKANADIVITEIGGTVGDIESQPFLEAIRQVAQEVGPENALFIHVTLVPYLKSSGEHKSKPTQHSVKELQSMGIKPNIIVLRTDEPITDDSIFHKIALFCNVQPDCVIENLTIPVLYEAPIMLEKNHFSDIVCRELKLDTPAPDMSDWLTMVEKIRSRKKTVKIALVGKYVKLHDAYLSVMEALRHAGYDHSAKVEIDWVDSETLTEENVASRLRDCHGMVIPGGFGHRGIEGMVLAAKYARESGLPFLGICLGMQIAVIEFCRNVCGIADANSGEFDEYGLHKVIDFMPDQNKEINKGGTLRLGSYPCQIKPGTKMAECYGQELIHERHRHRYEFNNDYRETVEAAGMVLSGTSPDGHIVETVELPEHPFFVAGQFHPEFKSRPNRSHPLFRGLIGAAVEYMEENESKK